MAFKMEKSSFGDYSRITGRFNTLAPFFMMSANQESLGGSGDISVTCYNTKLFTTASYTTVTLKQGLQDGQLKKIALVHKGNEDANAVVSCPSLIGPSNEILFTNVGDYVLLGWTGGSWCVLETSNSTDPTLQTPVVQ